LFASDISGTKVGTLFATDISCTSIKAGTLFASDISGTKVGTLFATDISCTSIKAGTLFASDISGTKVGTLTITEGLYLNVGTTITGNTVIQSPYAQFYTINTGSAITITLPAPSTSNKGLCLKFRRVSALSSITFTVNSSSLYIYGYNSTTQAPLAQASSIVDSSRYSFEFICDGNFWYQTYAM